MFLFGGIKFYSYLCSDNISLTEAVASQNSTIMTNNKNIRVAFHIGRGGHFHNPGHKTFNPNVHTLLDCCADVMIISEDENGHQLPDEQWQLVDSGSNVIVEGRQNIESETGILEWDTIYNTDIVRNIEDCDYDELVIIRNYIEQEGSTRVDDDVVAYISDYFNKE